MKVFVFGTGNVAHSLVYALKKANQTITGVYGRNVELLNIFADKFNLVPFSDFKNIPDSDLYFICVKDDAIGFVAEQLNTDKTVVHCSGSTDISVLEKFKNRGVIYPVQTFSKSKIIDFDNITLLVEYQGYNAQTDIESLSRSLSHEVKFLDSAARKKLHLSAVFACNFVNHMFTCADLLCKDNNVDFVLLKPLIEETMEKALQGSPEKVQTGPAVRKDFSVLNSHAEMLENYPELKKIYSFVSNNIIAFRYKK